MSIYDSKFVSEGDYYDKLRGNVRRDYNKETGRASEDYGFTRERLDYGINDLREDVGTGKTRAREDTKLSQDNINRQLASISRNTFQRYVRNGASQPTQIGLQNLATKAAALEKDRADFLTNRNYDRTIFDLDKTENRGNRDYGLNSRINRTSRDRRYEDASDRRDDSLLGLNRTASASLEEMAKVAQAATYSSANPAKAPDYMSQYNRFF